MKIESTMFRLRSCQYIGVLIMINTDRLIFQYLTFNNTTYHPRDRLKSECRIHEIWFISSLTFPPNEGRATHVWFGFTSLAGGVGPVVVWWCPQISSIMYNYYIESGLHFILPISTYNYKIENTTDIFLMCISR